MQPYSAYLDSGLEWLGEVPEHWEVRPFRHVCRLAYGDSLASEAREIGDVPVFGSNGVVGEHDTPNTLAPAIVIGRKGSYGEVNFSDSEAFAIDMTYFVDQRYTTSDLRWLFYTLLSADLADVSKDSAIPGLSREDAYEKRLPVPPLDEQRDIAAFLDRETERIDSLIAKKRLLIERLQEYRTALITRTVTRGLPPEAARAAGLDSSPRLKPSGVEWLGDVPEHWAVKQLKWETPVQRGASPRPIDDDAYFADEGSHGWVRISDVTVAGMYLQGTQQRLSPLGISLSVPLEPGDLFLSIAGSVGKPCISRIHCCIHDGFVYFPSWRGDTRFLYFAFAAGECFKGLGKLGTQLNLNTDTVGAIRVAFPPLNEQRAISAYLEERLLALDSAGKGIQSGLKRLQEYRSALITAAVTGKIDVRGAASSDRGSAESPA